MSCDDEDYSSSPGRPDYSVNRVYMLDPESEYSTIEYKASGEFINQLENPLTLTQIRCTRPAPEDVTVTVEIDPTLVAEYNAANDKDYELMQGAKLVNTTFTIPRGEFLATEKLAIDFEDHSAFVRNESDLVLPVAITKVTGGLSISKTSRFFIVFDYKANSLTPKTTVIFNADVDESGWQDALTNSVVDGFMSATWAAEFPVTVTATVDNSLIASYNATNGTDYVALDATPQAINIAEGATQADLKITFGDYTGVAEGCTYLVPLKLEITSGEGAALESDVVYIIVRKLPVSMSFVSKTSSWTKIDPLDNWSAIFIFDDEEEDATDYVKGESGTYVYTGDVIKVDLGTPTKIGAMGLTFYQWYYALTSITDIQISEDGNVWTPIEGCDFGSSARYTYLAFNKPQTFRYIRFACGDYYYPSYGCYLKAITFWNY